MSYDILVFDPAATSDEDFPAWWEEAKQRPDSRPWDDPSVTTPELRAFYEDMRQHFPDMNGPDSPSDEELDSDPDLNELMTSYSFDTDQVVMCFSWHRAAQARAMTETLALRHGVAVARVSDDSSILRP